MSRLSVALCDDFVEERWPSMDRIAAMLAAQLSNGHRGRVSATRVCPEFVRTATRLPFAREAAVAVKADRFLNRFWRYPQHAALLRSRFDLFHVIDHSYAHLVNALPAERTVVTCHDLDAFRSLLEPQSEPRSTAFRSMTKRIAAGLRNAAHVICDTDAIRRDLLDAGLAEPARVSVVPLGVDEKFFGESVPPANGKVDILHVGSTAGRKRIDILLRIVAALAAQFPSLRLIRVGDGLADHQRQLAETLGITKRIVEERAVGEDALAQWYRRAALVVHPSDREGFGLPVLEALASGTPVVASDLPVLREVAGDTATFCTPGDVDEWARTAAELLRERTRRPNRWRARQERGRARARQFTWRRFADGVVGVYEQLAGTHA